MAVRRACPYYLGAQPAPARGFSMLLSFERPASAGHRGVVSANDAAHMRGDQPTFYASSRSLKTAQKPHQPPLISGG